MKKIGVVSFRYDARQFDNRLPKLKKSTKINDEVWTDIEGYASFYNEKRLKQLKTIRDYAADNNVSHILFPGRTLAVTYSLWDNNVHEEYLEEIANVFSGFSIIIEAQYISKENEPPVHPVDTGIICFNKYGVEVGNRIQQLFAERPEKGDRYDRLLHEKFWSENEWGHRIKKLQGIRFLIWVCGEINFLNDPKESEPTPHYDFGSRFIKFIHSQKDKQNFDILFNPAHTPWKRTSILQNKLKYLCKKGTISIHTTNVPAYQTQTNGAIYYYKNGKDAFEYKWKNKWPKDTSWIMETIEI